MSLTRSELASRLAALEPETRAYARRLAGDAHDAEDMHQEAVLRAMRHAADLRSPAKLGPWLKRIIRNLAIDARRRAKLGRAVQLLNDDHAAKTPEARDLHAEIDRILGFLGSFEENYEQVIPLVMNSVFDWSVEQIGHQLCIKPNTVTQRLRRLKRRLEGVSVSRHDAGHPRAKAFLLMLLMREAMDPVQSDGFRSLRLQLETHAMMHDFLRQHPNDLSLLHMIYMLTCSLLMHSQYASDTEPPRFPSQWRRELWDPAYREEALSLRRRLEGAVAQDAAGAFTPDARFGMAVMDLLYLPMNNSDVEWPKIWALCDALPESRRNANSYTLMAEAKETMEGAAASARWLSGLMSNKHLRDSSGAYFRLGNLHLDAGQWEESRRLLRKYLKFPCSPAYRRHVAALIARCEKHL